MKPAPFTCGLSYLLLGVAFVYLSANIAFVTLCDAAESGGSLCAVCAVTKPFGFVETAIPAIARPMGRLAQAGDPSRAERVGRAYGFAWVSAFAALIVMSMAGMIYVALLSTEARHLTKAHLAAESDARSERERDLAKTGMRLFIALGFLAFLDAFWGFYSFDSYSFFANMVQERDRDLYRPGLGLFCVLLLATPFISKRATRIALSDIDRV